MISLTLAQARRALAYSAVLYFLPLLAVWWFPSKYSVGGAVVAAFLLYVWRDNFTRKVSEAGLLAELEEGPSHTATSSVADVQIGFQGSGHDCDED